MPKPEPAAVASLPPPAPNAPPFAAPPPVWQQPPPPSRVPLIAGTVVITLVLVAGGYWFLRDSTLFQQQPSAGQVIVTPTNQTPQYDRADRIVNKILVPDLGLIETKLSQGGGACSAGGNCLAALENLEPALAKAVADLDSSGEMHRH